MAIKCIVSPSLSAEQLTEAVEKLYTTYTEANIKRLDIEPKGVLFSMIAIYEDGSEEAK